MSVEPEKRDSRALEPELITDPTAKAEAETRNGFRQYDLGIRAIQTALDRGAFKLRPSLVLALHREALAGISLFAGNFRPAGVEIHPSPRCRQFAAELPQALCSLFDARRNVGESLLLINNYTSELGAPAASTFQIRDGFTDR